MTSILKKHPELPDLIGKGARAAEPEMPFFERRTSIFGEQFDGMSLPELQAHLARANAYEFAAQQLRRGLGGYAGGGPIKGTPPIDLNHGQRAANYDASVLAPPTTGGD